MRLGHQNYGLLFAALIATALLLLLTTPTPALAAPSSVALTSTINTVVPNTGLVLWPGNSKMTAFKDSISLEYSYINPSSVALSRSSSGVITYDWSPIHSFLNAAHGRGHAGIVRFYYVYPGETTTHTNVPAFIRQTAGYSETKLVYDGEDLYYPDWSSTELQAFHKQFVTDFAAEFDSNPKLAYLQVGFGHWGEYHIHNNNKALTNYIKLGENFPSKAFQREFMTHLSAKMVQTPWSISIDSADSVYTDFVANPFTSTVPFGLFDDSFMHENHEGDYNEECWTDLAWFTSRWKYGVAGGEVSYYTKTDQANFLNPNGMYGYKFRGAGGQAEKYKLTYLLANDAPSSTTSFKPTPADFADAAVWMGYRFEVAVIMFDAAHDEVLISMKNNGVAPPYHHHYAQIQYPVNGSTQTFKTTDSLRYLEPGASTTVKIGGVNVAQLKAHIATLPAASPSWLQIASPKSEYSIPYSANCVACPDGHILNTSGVCVVDDGSQDPDGGDGGDGSDKDDEKDSSSSSRLFTPFMFIATALCAMVLVQF